MNKRRIIIIGRSLYAESLRQMLTNSGFVCVTRVCPSLREALAALRVEMPDAVIFAGTGEAPGRAVSRLLAAHPQLPILCTDLEEDTVRLFTSKRIGRRVSDLLDAITSLPQRR